MSDDKKEPVCIINKTIKKINLAGTVIDYKNVVVQGKNMKETKKVFHGEWKNE